MKLCIGIATTGDVKTKTLFSIVQLFKKYPDSNLVTWEGCNVHQSRINIVKEAQKGNCTHILFVDSDMVFDVKAVEMLLEYDKDIVGVDYNMRKLPLTSTVKIHDLQGNKIFDRKEELYECIAVGTGFMLIKMDVFEKVTYPWFFYEQENNEMKVGSDMWFCNKAREAGYQIYADPTLKVGHLGEFIY